MKLVNDAGNGFTFPSRTVYLAQDEGLVPERQRDADAQMRAWSATLPKALPEK
jgi:hypothetical protein